MRSRFDTELDVLNAELTRMGAFCEDAIACSMRSLFEGDAALREKTYELDSEIDRLEKEIENLCMKLLLLHHPVAIDLRNVSSALKMISDMERIGDQASDIAEIGEFIKNGTLHESIRLREMADAAMGMVTDSVDSFVKKDLRLARKVLADDDTVDGHFDRIKYELIGIIAKAPESGEYCLDLLMVAKYLERIGDHATNIAEWVEYCLTGRHKTEGCSDIPV